MGSRAAAVLDLVGHDREIDEGGSIMRKRGNIAGIGSDWRGICLLAHRGMRRNSRHEMVV
jgi:hypothetical protein